MKHLYLPLFSLFVATNLFAQVEDESCLPPDKKVLKLVQTGKAASTPQEAVENFGKAIESAPDNAMPLFEFAVYYYHLGEKQYESNPNPAAGDKSFAKAEQLLIQAYDLCSNYHSDMFYFLGIINYTQEEMEESQKWFKLFVDYTNEDNARYSEEFAKQTSDVKKLLSSFKQEEEMKTKEVPFNPFPVRNVSSSNDEYFPMISPDNMFMFYTRRIEDKMGGYTSTGNMKEVYTFSQRKSENEDFTTGTAFAAPFNIGDFHSYGAASMSVDNKEMIICACKKTKVMDQLYTDCDLYSTTFEKIGPNPNDYKWSALENLGPKINTADGWEGQPSLSADGQTMFFTAVRPTTQMDDVFMVKREADGSWGTPVPFTQINTSGKDKSPFLHQDSETLYFVSQTSKTRSGAGGLDIFYMREENGVWGEPKNIGFPINSPNDEIGLFVSTDGKIAYFSSFQGGNWNIYGFELYEEARPKPVTILKGELKNDQGMPVENASIEIAYADSDKVETVKVNGNDGRYAVVVKQEKPQDIIVSVKKEGAAYDSKLITKEEVQSKTANTELKVNDLKVGQAYTINNILYDYNSDVLSEKSKFVLREFARYLKANENIKIVIQGHTDSDGDDAKNLDLSARRAKGVEAYLVSLGIDASRLSAKGLGETSPKVPNDTAENKAQNRRTEFLIEGL